MTIAPRVGDVRVDGTSGPGAAPASPPAAIPLVKPRLRGRLHQAACIASLVTGTALVCLAPTGRARVAAAVYAASVTLLFGTSALYHTRTWGAVALRRMRRLDHSMILVLIAGTYTPLALLLIPGRTGTVLLVAAWVAALLGVAVRLLWQSAPRWATVLPYVLVGGMATLVVPQLLAGGGVVTVALVLAGGLLYLLGALVYATQRPDPRPLVLGFHEVFHLLTIVAGILFYVAVSFAVYRA